MMTLVYTHENSDMWYKFSIYELSQELQKRHDCKYILSQGTYSDRALENPDKLIENLREYQYEGKFQTFNEARYWLMYAVEAIGLQNLKYEVQKMREMIEKAVDSAKSAEEYN